MVVVLVLRVGVGVLMGMLVLMLVLELVGGGRRWELIHCVTFGDFFLSDPSQFLDIIRYGESISTHNNL